METKTLHFAEHGITKQGNYRLLDSPIQLVAESAYYVIPDGDSWAPAPLPSSEERYKAVMRIRGPRKQRAARAKIPKESIIVVTDVAPVTRPEAMAILKAEAVSKPEVKTAKAQKLEVIESQIRALFAQLLKGTKV